MIHWNHDGSSQGCPAVLKNVEMNLGPQLEDTDIAECAISSTFHDLIDFGRRIRVRDFLPFDGNVDNYTFEQEAADLTEADDRSDGRRRLLVEAIRHARRTLDWRFPSSNPDRPRWCSAARREAAPQDHSSRDTDTS
jgi:hypothetical protein